MNFLKQILFVNLFFNIVNNAIAQNTFFEKIEYASFNVVTSKSKSKNPIQIDLYYKIDKNGLIKVLNDDDYHNTLTFNTYQLSLTQLKKINSIFNYMNHLKDYVIRRSLNNDEFFQGSYNYFSVVYRNGRKDSLCFIAPFMSKDFQEVYHMLDSIYWADKKRLKKIRPFSIPKRFKNAVELNYKKSGLPKKKSLPPYRKEDQ